MKTYKCFMSETVFYQLIVTVEDDATDDDIAQAAEETFVQGHYEEHGCDERGLDDWELIEEQITTMEKDNATTEPKT